MTGFFGVFEPNALRYSQCAQKNTRNEVRVFLCNSMCWGCRCFQLRLALLGYSLSYRLIEQLHYSHRRRITGTMPHFQNPQIATRALLETRAQLIEELANRLLITQPIEGQPAIGNAVYLCQGYQRLYYTPQLFSFWQSGTNGFVLDQRRRHVAVHRFTMTAFAPEDTA